MQIGLNFAVIHTTEIHVLVVYNKLDVLHSEFVSSNVSLTQNWRIFNLKHLSKALSIYSIKPLNHCNNDYDNNNDNKKCQVYVYVKGKYQSII